MIKRCFSGSCNTSDPLGGLCYIGIGRLPLEGSDFKKEHFLSPGTGDITVYFLACLFFFTKNYFRESLRISKAQWFDFFLFLLSLKRKSWGTSLDRRGIAYFRTSTKGTGEEKRPKECKEGYLRTGIWQEKGSRSLFSTYPSRTAPHPALGPTFVGGFKSHSVLWLAVGVGQWKHWQEMEAGGEWGDGICSHSLFLPDHQLAVGPSSIAAHSSCLIAATGTIEVELQLSSQVSRTNFSPGPFLLLGSGGFSLLLALGHIIMLYWFPVTLFLLQIFPLLNFPYITLCDCAIGYYWDVTERPFEDKGPKNRSVWLFQSLRWGWLQKIHSWSRSTFQSQGAQQRYGHILDGNQRRFSSGKLPRKLAKILASWLPLPNDIIDEKMNPK